MALVYRLEHTSVLNRVTGHPSGPYNTDPAVGEELTAIGQDLCDAHCDIFHPSPYADDIYPNIFNVCGMSNLSALRKWFYGWIAPLRRAGFAISEYEVPEKSISRGTKSAQVIFDVADATLVRHL